VASLGVEPEPDPLAVSSDPFVLDLARAKTALSRGEETVLGRAVESVAGVPLLGGGRVLGVLVVLDREARGPDAPSFDEEDRRFLVSLAGLVAPTLDAARRFRALAADLDQERRAHAADVQRLTEDAARAAADAAEQRARADAAQVQASDARAAHTEMIAELAAARQRVEDERAHTQTRLADQRAGYEDRLTELRAEIDKIRGQNTRRAARGAAAD